VTARTQGVATKKCRFVISYYDAWISAGHLTRHNHAALAAERGDHAEAERLWRDVLAECPGDRETLAILNRLPVTVL
jgi:hypothetical protein